LEIVSYHARIFNDDHFAKEGGSFHMEIQFDHPVLDIAQSLMEIKKDLKIINPAFHSLMSFSIRTKDLFFGNPKNRMTSLGILFLNSIELFDAIDILVNQSSVYQCNQLIRSLFEAKISIEYILQSKTMERSLAWEYFACKDNIKRIKTFTDTSPNHLKNFSQDKALKNEKFPPPNVADLLAQKQSYLTILEGSSMKIVVDEIARITLQLQIKERELRWYSLFPSEQSKKILKLDTLFEELEHKGIYLLSYKYLSQYAHSTEYTRFFRSSQTPKNWPLLRGKDELWHVVILTSELQNEIDRLFCEYAQKTEEYKEFERNFQPKLDAMKKAFIEQYPIAAVEHDPMKAAASLV
jgi:hypothetical protein